MRIRWTNARRTEGYVADASSVRNASIVGLQAHVLLLALKIYRERTVHVWLDIPDAVARTVLCGQCHLHENKVALLVD